MTIKRHLILQHGLEPCDWIQRSQVRRGRLHWGLLRTPPPVRTPYYRPVRGPQQWSTASDPTRPNRWSSGDRDITARAKRSPLHRVAPTGVTLDMRSHLKEKLMEQKVFHSFLLTTYKLVYNTVLYTTIQYNTSSLTFSKPPPHTRTRTHTHQLHTCTEKGRKEKR